MVVNLLADLKSVSGFGHHSKKQRRASVVAPKRRTDYLQPANYATKPSQMQYIFRSRQAGSLPRSLTQSDQHRALDCRMRRVLDLYPLAAASRTVATAAPLGDNAFEAHAACVQEHLIAVGAVQVLGQPDARTAVT
jgi:hypothetical protein